RKSDRRFHRVAAADPIPETEHVGGVDAEARNLRSVSRDRHKVPAHRLFIAKDLDEPRARRLRIRMCLERREGFRTNDEQRLCGVQIARRLDKVSAVYVRNKTTGERTVAVIPQRFIRHHRSEIRTPDADVDDVAY